MSLDYYSVLGVEKNASKEEIKKAYKKKVLKHHPDRVDVLNKDSAKKEFQKIQEAYEILSDEKKRSIYDSVGHDSYQNHGQGFGGAGFEFDSAQFDGFENIFTDFFGGGFERPRSRAHRGEDLRYSVKITLEQAFSGVKIKIVLPKMISCNDCLGKGINSKVASKTCYHCNGTGQIKMKKLFLNIAQPCGNCEGTGVINEKCKTCSGQGRFSKKTELEVELPKGVSDGVTLRLQNEGNAGIEGGRAGDLLVVIQVQKHVLFEVNGIDLNYKASISIFDAVLGAEIKVPTITNEEVSLNIKPGTQAFSNLKIHSKGMPSLRSSKKGDMNVIVNVNIPEKISSKEKELWQQLKEESSKKKGFWS